MSTLETMLETFAKRREPITLREDEQRRRLARQAEINDELLVLQAKIGVFTRSREGAMADNAQGKVTELTGRLDELTKLIAALESEGATLEGAYSKEQAEIARELSLLADAVLTEAYPAVKAKAHEAIRQAIVTVEEAWHGLTEYAQKTRAHLESKHKEQLIPGTSLRPEDEKRLGSAIDYWFTDRHGRQLKN